MNAAALTAFRAQAQTTREVLRPGTIRISGTDYACAIFRSGIRHVPDDDGHMQKVEFLRLDVRKALLATQPDAVTVITCSGVDWFINPNEAQVDAGETWVVRAKRIC